MLTLALAASLIAAGAKPHLELLGDPIPVGPMAGTPTLADLDADGDLDVVVTCGPCCGMDPDPTSGHVRILTNDGTGRLRYAGDRIGLGETALGSAVGDVNEDGVPDVVVHHHSSYEVAVLLGEGSARFASPTSVRLFEGESPHVHSIALADADGDGHLDILATLVDDHALAVLLGDGSGGFTPALGQPFFAHRHPYMQLNPVDINEDGNLDVVLTDVRGNGLTVLVGSGTGMFAPSNGFSLDAHTPIAGAERPLACDLADLDSDGDLDAVAFIDERPHAIRLINEGRGRFVEPEDALVTLAVHTTGGRLADVTEDGFVDLIASGTMTDKISITMGRPDGAFIRTSIPFSAGGQSPSVAVGDMNGDGKTDVVTGNSASGTVSVLINKVPGRSE